MKRIYDNTQTAVFFIAGIEKKSIDSLGWLDTGDIRVFGYKETFEQAKKALNENWCDMHEHLYKYAVVEEIPSGIHPDVINRWFFEWNENKEGFFEIEEPKEFLEYCNFTIG